MSSAVLTFLLSVGQCAILGSALFPKASSQETERWAEPCRGTIRYTGNLILNHFNFADRNEIEQSHRLWLKAEEIYGIASDLRDIYAEDRVQSTNLRVSIDENTTLPGFPNSRVLNSGTQFMDKVYENYRRAAIAAVFVQQMYLDESQSSYSPNLTYDFLTLESKLYPFLCFSELTFLKKVPLIERDIMNSSLRNTHTTADRHIRDYHILRDLVKLFESIQKDFYVRSMAGR